MSTILKPQKVECRNPNTGGTMNIDKTLYELFSKAIYHTLKKYGPISFTQLVAGVTECFAQQKTKFDGSISWYTVTIKNDMQTKRIINVFMEKGKKLHCVNNQFALK